MLAIKRKYSLAAMVAVLSLMPAAIAQDHGQGQQSGKPFVLGAETNSYNAGPSYPAYPAYPAPQMIPQQPQQAPIKPHKLSAQQNRPLQGQAEASQPRPPMQAQA